MAIVPSQLQELLVDEQKASEIRSILQSQGMEHLLGDPKHSSIDCMRLLSQYGADGQVSNPRSSSLVLSKSEATCRYYTMPGGSVGGEKCIFSHPAAEFMSLEMGQSSIPKQTGGTKRVGAEELGKKIFVGGLSSSVESENFPPSSMWGQDSKRIKVGGYGIQGSETETYNSACQLYEDSPHSNESNFGKPSGHFSAASSPTQGFNSKMAGICEMCFERGALWPGFRFHAVTKTCAPFAKASCVKEIKTMPNASFNGSVER